MGLALSTFSGFPGLVAPWVALPCTGPLYTYVYRALIYVYTRRARVYILGRLHVYRAHIRIYAPRSYIRIQGVYAFMRISIYRVYIRIYTPRSSITRDLLQKTKETYKRSKRELLLAERAEA